MKRRAELAKASRSSTRFGTDFPDWQRLAETLAKLENRFMRET